MKKYLRSALCWNVVMVALLLGFLPQTYAQSQTMPRAVRFGKVAENSFSVPVLFFDRLTDTTLPRTLTITASEGFQISTTQTGNFHSMLTLMPDSGRISMFIRFAPTAVQNYFGTIAYTSTEGHVTVLATVSGEGRAVLRTITPILTILPRESDVRQSTDRVTITYKPERTDEFYKETELWVYCGMWLLRAGQTNTSLPADSLDFLEPPNARSDSVTNPRLRMTYNSSSTSHTLTLENLREFFGVPPARQIARMMFSIRLPASDSLISGVEARPTVVTFPYSTLAPMVRNRISNRFVRSGQREGIVLEAMNSSSRIFSLNDTTTTTFKYTASSSDTSIIKVGISTNQLGPIIVIDAQPNTEEGRSSNISVQAQTSWGTSTTTTFNVLVSTSGTLTAATLTITPPQVELRQSTNRVKITYKPAQGEVFFNAPELWAYAGVWLLREGQTNTSLPADSLDFLEAPNGARTNLQNPRLRMARFGNEYELTIDSLRQFFGVPFGRQIARLVFSIRPQVLAGAVPFTEQFRFDYAAGDLILLNDVQDRLVGAGQNEKIELEPPGFNPNGDPRTVFSLQDNSSGAFFFGYNLDTNVTTFRYTVTSSDTTIAKVRLSTNEGRPIVDLTTQPTAMTGQSADVRIRAQTLWGTSAETTLRVSIFTLPPTVQVSPSELNFRNGQIRSPSTTQTFTIVANNLNSSVRALLSENKGFEMLEVTTGTWKTSMTIAPIGRQILGPIPVRFTPRSSALVRDTLRLLYDSLGRTTSRDVTLSGSGSTVRVSAPILQFQESSTPPITVRWNRVLNAERYDIQVAPFAQQSFFTQSLGFALPSLHDSNIVDTARRLPSTFPIGTYLWTARSKNTSDVSAWSQPLLLQLQPPATVTNRANITPQTITFKRTAVDDISSEVITLSMPTSGEGQIESISVLSSDNVFRISSSTATRGQKFSANAPINVVVNFAPKDTAFEARSALLIRYKTAGDRIDTAFVSLAGRGTQCGNACIVTPLALRIVANGREVQPNQVPPGQEISIEISWQNQVNVRPDDNEMKYFSATLSVDNNTMLRFIEENTTSNKSFWTTVGKCQFVDALRDSAFSETSTVIAKISAEVLQPDAPIANISLTGFRWNRKPDGSYRAGATPGGTLTIPFTPLLRTDEKGRKRLFGAARKRSLITAFSPNPVESKTIVQYSVADAMPVTISVVNTMGQRMATLTAKHHEAGSYEASFDAVSLSRGIYFLVLQTPFDIDTRKMEVLR
ncbi:MAG: T9SS C-terminal target domain-containing protein [Candidatus Kapaibacterium sp.]|nr:MAG: T9SS C-terminal target domain-containing protein [Candidatus Kapabacteria bacterium]